MIDIERGLKQLAVSPPERLAEQTILAADAGDRVAVAESTHGPLWISWSGVGVTGLTPLFVDRSAAEFIDHHRRACFKVQAMPSQLRSEVDTALATGHPGRLTFDLRGLTEFQAAVLTSCLTISSGSVRPYGWVAGQLGKPGASRAVGTALAKNPIPLLIPCHRVVQSSGAVGSYAFGSAMKRQLLISEGALLAGT